MKISGDLESEDPLQVELRLMDLKIFRKDLTVKNGWLTLKCKVHSDVE